MNLIILESEKPPDAGMMGRVIVGEKYRTTVSSEFRAG